MIRIHFLFNYYNILFVIAAGVVAVMLKEVLIIIIGYKIGIIPL